MSQRKCLIPPLEPTPETATYLLMKFQFIYDSLVMEMEIEKKNILISFPPHSFPNIETICITPYFRERRRVIKYEFNDTRRMLVELNTLWHSNIQFANVYGVGATPPLSRHSPTSAYPGRMNNAKMLLSKRLLREEVE